MSVRELIMAAAGLSVAPAYTYATWNPSSKSSGVVLSGGNLTFAAPTFGGVRATQGKSAGKWYFEFTVSSAVSGSNGIGLATSGYSIATSGRPGFDTNSIGHMTTGQVVVEYTVHHTSTAWSAGVVIGVAFDATARTVQFFLNGVAQGAAVSWSSAVEIFPAIGTSENTGLSGTTNFGASAFAYPVPSGYNPGVYV